MCQVEELLGLSDDGCGVISSVSCSSHELGVVSFLYNRTSDSQLRMTDPCYLCVNACHLCIRKLDRLAGASIQIQQPQISLFFDKMVLNTGLKFISCILEQLFCFST